MLRYDIEELGVSGFGARLDNLVAVYAAAMAAPAEQLAGRRVIMAGHAAYPGFAALAAISEGRVAGFSYGFHGQPGQWWHDHVATGVKPRWLGDCLEIAELHVLPEFQGQGVGTALLYRLTSGRPEQTAVLSTRDSETRARRLYRHLGFSDLLTGYRFDGIGTAYAIMGSTLPLSPSSS